MTDQAKTNMAIYVLLLVFTLPVLVLGQVFHYMLLPGLPLSSLAFCIPTITVIVFLLVTGKASTIRDLVKFLLSARSKKSVAILVISSLLMPLILVTSFVLDLLFGTKFIIEGVNPGRIPVLIAVFLFSAFGEEFLWTGYFLRQFKDRFSWRFSIYIACAYILWHAVPFFQTGKPVQWILAQILFSFIFRILMIEVYFSGKKIALSVILLHAGYNLAWQLYPNSGSYYDPIVTSVVALVALLLVEMVRKKQLAKSSS